MTTGPGVSAMSGGQGHCAKKNCVLITVPPMVSVTQLPKRVPAKSVILVCMYL